MNVNIKAARNSPYKFERMREKRDVNVAKGKKKHFSNIANILTLTLQSELCSQR